MKEEEERRDRRRQEDAEKGEEERKEVGEGEVEEEKKVVRYHSISHNQLYHHTACNFILQLMPTLITTHSTFIFSTRLVSMTMEAALWSQMSRQKSPTVSGRGPCVAMYSLRRL